MGFARRDEIFPPSPAFDFLSTHDNSQFRVIEVDIPYSSNAPLMYGLHSADGYEIGFTGHAFLDDLINLGSNGINFLPDRLLERSDRRIDLLNVKYVVVPAFVPNFKRFSQSDRFEQVFNNEYVAIFQNRSALPRTWLVAASGMEAFSDVETEVGRLKSSDFDPLKSVTSSERPPSISAAVPQPGSFSGSANLVESGATRFAITTKASNSAILLFSQPYYPGWKALIDGTPAQIFKADVMLTGVPVPAGAHEVVLVFQPLSFRIGLAVTILSIMILLAIAIGRGFPSHLRL